MARDRPSLMAGARLQPELRILSRLGAGGMGVVYKAIDESLDREVAVKLIHPELVRDEANAYRFLAEARAMARVRHPHVVQIFSFGRYLGQPFIVMELMEGETLEERLARTGQQGFAVDEALGLLDAVAQGVDAIHAAGVVHGDLKPANILFAASFRVAVSDFGLATRGSRGGDEGLGTAAYLAPERITAEDEGLDDGLGPAADLYALGCIAFELLTGDVPFDAPDAERIYMQHLYKDPPSLGSRRPELATRFDAAVLPFLAKDPMDRPAKARVLREELAKARRALPATRRKSRRVLHVDDDPDFRNFVAAVLTAELPEVELDQARDGEEAFRRYERGTYDLVIFDLRMPGMSGFELAATLVGGERRVPLLALTGEGGAADWQVLSKLGVDGFVLKPVEPLALVAAVRRHLQR
ncbi:MAG: protein kinase [Myxococcota bacterium]